MMETILNLGLNDDDGRGPGQRERQRARSPGTRYRRFVQMYGSVVFDLPKAPFEQVLEARKQKRRRRRATSTCRPPRLQALVQEFKALVAEGDRAGPSPTIPMEQLWGAIAAVFESWNTRRAIDYRKLHDIPDTLGTAVNVVTMVFGNMGEDSGTGVAFTRDPSTGEQRLYGEFLHQRPGRGRGRRHPDAGADRRARRTHARGLSPSWTGWRGPLERHFRDVQDMEFTIERGKLYMLQTRRGQRSGHAAVRIAVRDGGRRAHHARKRRSRRIPPNDLDQLLHPTIDPHSAARPAHHRPAGVTRGGLGHGRCSTPTWPSSSAAKGEAVILVRRETSPEDFHGMVAAKAILTARGGMTSHAAVVARGMGKPCVAGAQELEVDEDAGRVRGRTAASMQRGRLDHARRQHRPGLSRARPTLDRAGAVRQLRPAHGVGRQARGTSGSGSMPTRRPTPIAAATSAPRASASAAPSTCSSRATGSPRCAR